ncbi:MAG: TonB-dependent receptor family protein, partial [Flavobacteriaceae bacterium]|nr:TonB-dependent receptor family protein [Flavobacteriaceae bacterium]MBS9768150.1 TonB-dependent receptor family protein [Flavobacteriaceae bacterium]
SIAVVSFAQRYKGTVKDTQNKAIPFANVVLFSLPDSTFVTGTTTEENGQFLLECKKKIKKGYLEVSFIGYETKKVEAKAELGTIILQDAKNELGEVIVKARLPKMQVKNDAFVTTIQNSVLAKAGTANNVLQRLPMLTGKDGDYTVFGKGQAKIYINNREMRDNSELENLNSDDIKSVEIVTNPGARYNASVKAVIRIYTVKRVGDGLSFDVRSSYYQSKENADWIEKLNLNYRKKGWDIFSTISYKDVTNLQQSTMEQTTFVDTLWQQSNRLENEYHSKKLKAIIGTNYEISKKHNLGIKYTYSMQPYGKTHGKLDNIIYANDILFDEWTTKNYSNDKKNPNHILSGYYNGNFEKLSVNYDFTYLTKKDGSEKEINENSQNYDSRIIYATNDVENTILASKLVLSYPIFDGQLSVGSEYTNTHRNDTYWANQTVRSSQTEIKQYNNSFFAEYSKKLSFGQFSAGLRYEYLTSKYFVNNTFMEEQSKNYSQCFPSFSFGTKINKIGLQLSYTAKTHRPSYRQLRSNISYGNRFTLQTGNPFLSPSITHDISLGGSWKFIQLMLSYKYEKDAIIFWTEQMENNPSVAIIKYRNLDKFPLFVAYVSVSPTFGIWSPQLSFGVQKQWLKLETNKSFIHLNKPVPFASLDNSFRLPKQFLFTLDASFQGKGDSQNIYLGENVFDVNLGLTKSFIDDRLIISLKGYDIFKSKKESVLLYNKQMNFLQLNRSDSQEFEITIRYKFNTTRSKYKGKGAGNSEINRM